MRQKFKEGSDFQTFAVTTTVIAKPGSGAHNKFEIRMKKYKTIYRKHSNVQRVQNHL